MHGKEKVRKDISLEADKEDISEISNENVEAQIKGLNSNRTNGTREIYTDPHATNEQFRKQDRCNNGLLYVV